jgi:4-methyl-5(b-hydroxyethyl)-thiazole monophosphate biosynthesis
VTAKTALVILGNGFEEIEALAPVDLMRRAGVQCTTASCEGDLMVLGRSGIRVEADTSLDEAAGRTFDCLVVPGGPGTTTLRQDPRVLELVRAHHGEDKLIGAICAAPTVLLDAGVLPGIQYTGHASILSELPEIQEQAVVIDGRVLTSRGAGTAVQFALALVAALLGQAPADAVAASIHFGEGFEL